MQEYILIKEGVEETRQIKTNWSEVPLSQYVDAMTEPTQLASACKLCGLSAEEYAATTTTDLDVPLLYAIEMVKEGPKGKRPDWLPADLGQTSIGRFELARKYVRLAKDSHIQAYPYLYAIYAWEEEYDLLASNMKDFPVELFWRATRLPITEVIAACEHIMAELERVSERYAPILDNEPTYEEMSAGIDRFEKYGFFPTLLTYSRGDLTHLRNLLDVEADVFFYSLCIDTEKREYERRYHEFVNRKR